MHTSVAGDPVVGPSGIHDALLYRTNDDYVAGLTPFLQAGLLAGDPVFVAAPPAHCDLLRTNLAGTAAGVQFADMTAVGRNPARIIPAIQQFLDAHPRQRVRFVGEPIWPGRSPAEICEATRHEAMLNTVFADRAVDIICPYDVAALDAATVADAWRTHPTVVDGDMRCNSPGYGDPVTLYAAGDPLEPPAPEHAPVERIAAGELPRLRDIVRGYAREAGLSPARTRDLVLAVNEVATNTLMHTAGDGSFRIWRDSQSVICEIHDTGQLSDPLAGRHSPANSAVRGRGLWMVNQLCDLVQWRSCDAGTTVRLYVDHVDN